MRSYVRTKGLPGFGPWKILDDCPAPFHNTLTAAEGRRPKSEPDTPRPRCVCPRGVALVKIRAARHAEKWKQNSGRIAARKARIPIKVADEPIVEMPDLSAGACRRPALAKFVEGGFSVEASAGGIAARERAKVVCESHCPVFNQCRAYVLAAESPAGSWGGVWGGLDPWNRRGQRVVITNKGLEVLSYARY